MHVCSHSKSSELLFLARGATRPAAHHPVVHCMFLYIMSAQRYSSGNLPGLQAPDENRRAAAAERAKPCRCAPTFLEIVEVAARQIAHSVKTLAVLAFHTAATLRSAHLYFETLCQISSGGLKHLRISIHVAGRELRLILLGKC